MKKIKVDISGYTSDFTKALDYILNNLNGLKLIEKESECVYIFKATENASFALNQLQCADCIYVEVIE